MRWSRSLGFLTAAFASSVELVVGQGRARGWTDSNDGEVSSLAIVTRLVALSSRESETSAAIRRVQADDETKSRIVDLAAIEGDEVHHLVLVIKYLKNERVIDPKIITDQIVARGGDLIHSSLDTAYTDRRESGGEIEHTIKCRIREGTVDGTIACSTTSIEESEGRIVDHRDLGGIHSDGYRGSSHGQSRDQELEAANKRVPLAPKPVKRKSVTSLGTLLLLMTAVWALTASKVVLRRT